MENTTTRQPIPNNAFDIEYRTQWRDEVDFLESRGIYYTIRKREGEYGIPVYKYTRTAELFLALADFYLHRLPNRKSQATYTGRKPEARRPRYEQQSFLNTNGSINKQFDVYENKSNEKKVELDKSNYIDLDKIKEAQEILKQAENQVGKEKLAKLTAENLNTGDTDGDKAPQDDTE